MTAGLITQTGTPHELYGHPANAGVAHALGEANLLPTQLDTGHAITVLGRHRILGTPPQHGPFLALVRPADIIVTTRPDADAVPARLIRHDYRGHDHRLELQVATAVVIAYSDHPPASGGPLYLRAQSTVHVLR